MHRTDTDSNERNAPWWVGIITKYGIATAIAAWLIYWATVSLSADLRAVGADVRSIHEEHSIMRVYLRQVCINTAKVDSERASCLIEDVR